MDTTTLNAPITDFSQYKTSPKKVRIESIDILRGLIMLIMALDHVRDFFHPMIPANDPTNLATTTPVLFFTRWITHYCAPLFIFLSGISARIAGTRRTKKELSLFLIKRGVWLVIVELIIVFAHSLDPLLHLVIFQVIWAIAASMIVLGLVVWLPKPVIAVLGGVIFFGHDILDYVSLPQTGTSAFLWKMFFTAHTSLFNMTDSYALKLNYAVMPWAGVMMLGYVFGSVYRSSFDSASRRKILRTTGVSLIALFLVFRTFNIYGDPAPWTAQGTAMLNFISFLNVSKYPPSLLYLCVTLGPGLILLSLFERVKGRFANLLIVYGNVPMLYYVMHWFLLRILSVAEFYISGYGSKDIYNPKMMYFFRPNEMGYSLVGVYVAWLLVISLLYFPCRAFAQYKRTHRHWWLSYL